VDVNGRYDLLVANGAGATNVLTWKQVVWCRGVPFFVFADHEGGGAAGDGANATVAAALRPRLVKAMTLHFQGSAKRHMAAYVPDAPPPPPERPTAAGGPAAAAPAAAAAAAADGAAGRPRRRLRQRRRPGWPRWASDVADALGWPGPAVGGGGDPAAAASAVLVRSRRVCVCDGAACRACRPLGPWLRRVANSRALGEQLRRAC